MYNFDPYLLRDYRQIRRDTKQRLVDHLGGCCSECGFNTYLASLQFHHIDPSLKEFTIASQLNPGVPFELLLKEANKCCLLCANCHTAFHAGEFSVLHGRKAPSMGF